MSVMKGSLTEPQVPKVASMSEEEYNPLNPPAEARRSPAFENSPHHRSSAPRSSEMPYTKAAQLYNAAVSVLGHFPPISCNAAVELPMEYAMFLGDRGGLVW